MRMPVCAVACRHLPRRESKSPLLLPPLSVSQAEGRPARYGILRARVSRTVEAKPLRGTGSILTPSGDPGPIGSFYFAGVDIGPEHREITHGETRIRFRRVGARYAGLGPPFGA